jgi:[glutamine synthetase] adenylyltransferase / [glutamine synthetase]-adenylyl-L-tyrosine phosphorylase
MLPRGDDLLRIAFTLDRARAADRAAALAERFGAESRAHAVAVLLSTAYPPFAATVNAHPQTILELAETDFTRDMPAADHAAALRAASPGDVDRQLRLYATRERMRIALRELLPPALGGADIERSARELSDLADATIQAAYEASYRHFAARFGEPFNLDGTRSRFVVMGMGKLGGGELNAGSDVDLIYFYEADQGEVRRDGEDSADPDAPTIDEFWQRVARKLTSTLDEITADGQVWRVDLRLRPDGAAGALVWSVPALERYYESFGRLWERSAMIRARPVAGSLALGDEILDILTPFVWRRRIDPSLARELHQLVRRARVELSADPERDLKLGPGGIREAEFFVQTLQLIWGGKDPSVRARPTLVALRRLEARGLVTTSEAREISDGYVVLRRAEHAIQWITGVQTHSLPEGTELELVARVLGFRGARPLLSYLAGHRRRVEARFVSLLPDEAAASDWSDVLVPIEQRDHALLLASLRRRLPEGLGDDEEAWLRLVASLTDLGAHPDAPLGTRTQESFPGFAESLLGALFDAVDVVQAARYLRVFFARVKQRAVYVRLLASDPAALRRLVSRLGASSYVGDALGNNPDLGDVILFQREVPTERRIRDEVAAAAQLEPKPDVDPDEALLGSLRLAKTRLTLEIALHDLTSNLEVSQVHGLLSTLAEATLTAAIERVLPARTGLAILAMGKLGGRELGYGSDLDIVFVFDPAKAPEEVDAPYHFTKVARRVIRLIQTFHGAGPGYDLDTRLRPSGNQGLLVTSLDAFSAYHGDGTERAGPRAQVWERMALVRARFVAGDPELGARAEQRMRQVAFGAPPPREIAAEQLRHVRDRVLKEMAREKADRYDIKLGRGGLLEVEFIVQFLQILHGPTLKEAAKSQETRCALEALVAAGVIGDVDGRALLEAYAFLRRLELRLRVSRVDATHVLDVRQTSMDTLARRMGLRDEPVYSLQGPASVGPASVGPASVAIRSAGAQLTATYVAETQKVRAAFEKVFGVP